MEFTSNIQRLILKLCFVVFACSVLFWFSLFSYGLLYYLYIPAVAHVKPVHLLYDTVCSKDERCKNPYANISLTEKSDYELLTRGQVYAIELVLNMPESERNLNQGMFMVRLDMLSENGVTLQSSKRPACLRYRSPLFKIIYTLFYVPALLLGTTEEKQTLTVTLFEQFLEYNPIYYVFIEIEAGAAEVYSSELKIHAQFTGLRYMMYYWPVLSMIVGVGSNFFFLISIILVFWIRYKLNGSNSISLETSSFGEEAFMRQAIDSPGTIAGRTESNKTKSSLLKPKTDFPERTSSEQISPTVETISPHQRDISSMPQTSDSLAPYSTSDQTPTTGSGIRKRPAIPEELL